MTESPLRVEQHEGIALVSFDRQVDLDMLAVERVSEELSGLATAATCRGLRLDLGNVRFLASPALSMFIGLRRQMHEAGLPLAICGLNSDLQRLFRITRLDRLFVIAATGEEALAALRSPTGHGASGD